MTAQATGSGGSGQAAKSQGASRADAGYAAKVGGKIRSNTVFNVPDELANNPAVEYSVDLLPDGSVRGIRKLKSSGMPGFDDAVRRAIEKSQPFPPDSSGRAPSGFTVSHKPKDQ
jgi:colicin import membrane protein